MGVVLWEKGLKLLVCWFIFLFVCVTLFWLCLSYRFLRVFQA